MSKRERSPTLGMGLSLSPPGTAATSPQSTESFSTEFVVHSSEGSCVSCNIAEETKAMLLVGCTRCLMYVMLPEVDPKCPKCKSTVLLDFLNNEEITSKKTSTK
ncbi:unnamed protein product [Trifolium pratense]|uniref:Uncharacterized protein n=1 Tax=Trifolium pratense TaxID=57577 RepID=A0ACB0KEJ5_TRIPR|nr:unnamed protein product [Trifolium pratense]